MWSAESSSLLHPPAAHGTGSSMASPTSVYNSVAIGETSPATARRFHRYTTRIPLIAASLISSANATAAPTTLPAGDGNETITNIPYGPCDEPRIAPIDSASDADMNKGPVWLAGWAQSGASLPANSVVRLIAELDSLGDGWNGPASVAPSEYVKSDLNALADVLKTLPTPEVEADDDGSISLRWEAGTRMLALTLHGNGRAIGTMYPRTSNFPCEMKVRDRVAFDHFFALEEVRDALS